jgi:hypothetical protein
MLIIGHSELEHQIYVWIPLAFGHHVILQHKGKYKNVVIEETINIYVPNSAYCSEILYMYSCTALFYVSLSVLSYYLHNTLNGVYQDC